MVWSLIACFNALPGNIIVVDTVVRDYSSNNTQGQEGVKGKISTRTNPFPSSVSSLLKFPEFPKIKLLAVELRFNRCICEIHFISFHSINKY